jgi:hypothetical protein
MTRHSTLLTIRVIVESDDIALDEIKTHFLLDENVETAIRDAVRSSMCSGSSLIVECVSTSFTCLDESPGCGRCENCKRWTRDAEGMPETIQIDICRGAVVDGKLLCDECLPTEHPYAF